MALFGGGLNSHEWQFTPIGHMSEADQYLTRRGTVRREALH